MGLLEGIRSWWNPRPSESDLGGQIQWAVDERLTGADYLQIPAVARARELIVSLASMLEPVAWRDGYPLVDQPRVLVRPAPELTRQAYLAALVGSLFDHGTAVLWQPKSGRGADGRPEVSIVLPRDDVQIEWADASHLTRKVHWAERELAVGSDVLLIDINRRAGDLTGRSPLVMVEDSLARILAAELYAGDFFGAGIVPPIALKFDGTLTDTQSADVQTKWLENNHLHRPAVLPKGWDLKETGTDPQTAQLLETRAAGSLEVARALGIFPAELLLVEVGGSSLTYQNIAAALMTFLKVTVQPLYLAPVEEALSDLLPGTQSARFSTGEVERLDTAARWAAYETGLRAGFLQLEQIDRWEGWDRSVPPPIPPAFAATPAAPEVAA